MSSDSLRNSDECITLENLLSGPEWIVLGVNSICNLRCKMCDVGTGSDDTIFATNLTGVQLLNMPLELFREIANQAQRYYPRCKLGYAFTEPLIYPHLIESLEYANKKSLFTTVTTNALVLQKNAGDLVRSGLNKLFISVDGLARTHNFIRGHKRSFQRAMDGIETLCSLGNIPEISVFCTITKWNESELKSLADHFRAYPIKRLGFMHTNFTTKQVANIHNGLYGRSYPATHSNIHDFDPTAVNLDILHEQIQLIRNHSYPFDVVFSPDILDKRVLHIFYREPGKFIGKRCNDVNRNIMIKPDGTVIPAHARCYNVVIGNLYRHSLREIWTSDVANRFRKDLAAAGGLFPACSRCCSAFR